MEIGNFNELEVARILENGAYLEDPDGTEVFFPGTYFPQDRNINIGDKMNVFVYCDSRDRPVATTETPKAVVNRFALLKVKDVNKFGAFLDWGISKDLMVPFGQMLKTMKIGENVIVRVLFDDKSKRMIATPRLRPFLKKPDIQNYPSGKKVDCMVYEIKDFGAMVIMDDEYPAMVQISEFKKLPEIGERFTAFVREIRSDEKITLTLAPIGTARNEFRDAILQKLEEAGGFLPINDDSSPKEIFEAFEVSKKSFKKLAGNLMKFKKITMDEKGIYRSK